MENTIPVYQHQTICITIPFIVLESVSLNLYRFLVVQLSIEFYKPVGTSLTIKLLNYHFSRPISSIIRCAFTCTYRQLDYIASRLHLYQFRYISRILANSKDFTYNQLDFSYLSINSTNCSTMATTSLFQFHLLYTGAQLSTVSTI